MVADKLNNTVSFQYAPVAQLDRVLGYEPSGQRFESSRVRHFTFLYLIQIFFVIHQNKNNRIPVTDQVLLC